MSALVDLPDVDQLQELVEEIYKVSREIAKLKLEIKVREAEIVRNSYSDEKKISMSYIQNSLVVTGINNELVPLRARLAELETKCDYYKHKYEMLKMIIDIWRTQSANERLKI